MRQNIKKVLFCTLKFMVSEKYACHSDKNKNYNIKTLKCTEYLFSQTLKKGLGEPTPVQSKIHI